MDVKKKVDEVSSVFSQNLNEGSVKPTAMPLFVGV